MIEISVIVPTYRPAVYLFECLDSLVDQTFPKDRYEVILVLNGCSEPYKEGIETYLAEKSHGMNVRFIHTMQPGVSNARNLALDAAGGKYVTFIDDDDYVSVDYLEEMYDKASEDTIVLCYPYAFIDGHNQQIPFPLTDYYNRIAPRGLQLYTCARKYFSGPCMKLIPRSIIRDRRFDVSFHNCEDCLFLFLISDGFRYVDFTSQRAIYYRRYRDNSATMGGRSYVSLLKNGLRLMTAYSRIYLSSPRMYSLYFYVTRMLGAIKNMLNWEQHEVANFRNG